MLERIMAELLDEARNTLNPGGTAGGHVGFGGVAAAIRTASGSTYRGICVDTACSMGMCAEQVAITAMLTAGETDVSAVVAVMPDGRPGAPCGRCREFLAQLGGDPAILMPDGAVAYLHELLPYWWAGNRVHAAGTPEGD